jgi:CheY-like chemotaxis protein
MRNGAQRAGAGPVLITEDDHEIREALEVLLADVGFRVLTAADGRQALTLLKRLRGTADFPTVMLLDLMMPTMNGWELLLELRADPELAALPVVIVSAFADQAPKEGVRAVLKKPVQVSQLLGALASAMA